MSERPPTTVLLVRHGVTDWNLELRAQGHADVGLNDAGRIEAREVAESLAAEPVAAVYSSDLSRALDTARAIAAAHGVEVVADPAWREIDQGLWTGLTDDDIRRGWPDRSGPARHYSQRPGGESPAQVRRRALSALERVVAAHPGATVVVVSHGVTIRMLVAQALGLDERGSATLRGLANGGVASLRASCRDGGLVLEGLVRLDGLSPVRDDPNA